MQKITAKCTNIVLSPNGRAVVQFEFRANDKEAPSTVIAIQFADSKEVKAFEHLQSYSFEIKPT